MSEASYSCPALFISAPASGHGKTTITAALARLYRRQGKRVTVFKTGPDFLDPMVLEQASGQPVANLDLWMAGQDHVRRQVALAAAQSDVLLVEGVMGLYDGEPSSADLAQLLGIPVVAVINARGMGQTIGALAQGLLAYRPELKFAGVLANGVASPRHAQMLRQGLQHARPSVPLLSGLQRDLQFALPERHLGLVAAPEIADLDARLDAVAERMSATSLANLPASVDFGTPPAERSFPRLLEGKTIAVARDLAFSFIYTANLDLLQQMGATLAFFSPLADQALPPCDAVWLPGGYPELYLQTLQDAQRTQSSLREHAAAGKPLYAECGGMLFLLETIIGMDGASGRMCGVLPGQAAVQPRLQGLGYQTLSLKLPGAVGEHLRCHTFHYSRAVVGAEFMARGERLFDSSEGEVVYRRQQITASYLHAWFRSAPRTVAALFGGATA
ncbi:cobyrinate a,c-diamide synthase [Herbaspirillum seropedicae]|uniref:cobyrinate a,c-diamide synthase n=1 Tax=Herbaspirillum seropedicae TaxID=964 RepID=UPI0028609D22|nr:cobyrinate a,c-diamide synthase [Herbaspirillum seropedicae]MDR6393968.1 cobyrinic acid a,c-diamide synthase [Herbaspirillum seropedicae]